MNVANSKNMRSVRDGVVGEMNIMMDGKCKERWKFSST
mgnify:CR=1 FL=1